MNSMTRRVFFWTLTITFLATSPILVLYFSGYRYSPDRGLFIFTGSISVSSNPSNGIEIQVDGNKASAEISRVNRSFHIEGLKPGQHHLRISAPGFSSWSKDVFVKSGVATEFWNVLLTRDHYPETAFPLPEGSFDFFLSPDGSNAIVPIETSLGELLLLGIDMGSGVTRQLFSSFQFDLKRQGDGKIPSWSTKNASLVLIPLVSRDTNQEHFFVLDIETITTADVKDIAKLDKLRNVRWETTSNKLLAISNDSLYEIVLDSSQTNTLLAQNVSSYDTLGNSVIALEKETGTISEIPIGSPRDRTQITTAPPENFPLDDAQAFTIIPYDENRLVLINPAKGLAFLYNKGETSGAMRKLPNGTRGTQFSDDGKKLLSWTDWEITTTFTRKWEAQPSRKEWDQISIGRFSEKISFVQWGEDYEHVLFYNGTSLLVTELDDRGMRNVMPITTSTRKLLQVATLGSQGKLFLLSEATNSGMAEVQSIVFPEPNGFFSQNRFYITSSAE